MRLTEDQSVCSQIDKNYETGENDLYGGGLLALEAHG